MDFEEIIGAVAAGVVAGLVLAWIEKTWPASGVGRI